MKAHHANGQPCHCDQKWSDNPAAYVRNHPNQRGSDGSTFNDAVAASVKEVAR